MNSSPLTRLHISPLTPELLPIVLGPRLQKSAENISYQTLSAFPENDYGYIDLPSVDAARLVTKLNGAILKGRKMKVEEARPRKRSAQENADKEPLEEKSRKKAKKARSVDTREDSTVIEGHELSPGRKVKRGWTEPKKDSKKSKSKDKPSKKEKQQAKSKYSEKEELLFRTSLPENKADLDTAKKSKKKNKPTKEGKESTATVVHEFEKRTTQPSFLRDDAKGSQPTTEFVQGTGWLDKDGEVVQQEPTTLVERRSKPAKAKGLAIAIPQPAVTSKIPVQNHARNPSSASENDGESSDSSLSEPQTSAKPSSALLDDETSSSGSSDSDTDSSSDSEPSPSSEDRPGDVSAGLPTGSCETPATPPKIHPLEALFKKSTAQDNSAKPALGVETNFSFFGQDLDDIENDDLPPMPVTPFTTQDMHSRGMRSAAPTPDTAHPARFTSFAEQLASRYKETSDTTSRDNSEELAQSSTAATPAKVESEFEKRFWQERGANNKAWKASRRAALKDQRQKDNRLRPSRLGK